MWLAIDFYMCSITLWTYNFTEHRALEGHGVLSSKKLVKQKKLENKSNEKLKMYFNKHLRKKLKMI